jgi:hypothetical protein
MYDFYLGSRPQSLDEEIHYLISVKRLLPRWVNSIPDSEFASIVKILHDLGDLCDRRGQKLFLVETGVGASSLALAYFAMKHKGTALTWDFNSKKGSEIRCACNETIGTLFDSSINSAWRLIGYNSRSPYLGIGIISEWTDTVHFTMHDSEHVWENVEGELRLVEQFLRDGSVVAVDDAYYTFLHTDTAYINLTRKKLGLNPVNQIEGNSSRAHSVEVENFLQKRWASVESLIGEYQKNCINDVSIGYFSNEIQLRSTMGMAQVQQLETRFGAWKVGSRL